MDIIFGTSILTGLLLVSIFKFAEKIARGSYKLGEPLPAYKKRHRSRVYIILAAIAFILFTFTSLFVATWTVYLTATLLTFFTIYLQFNKLANNKY